MPVPILKLCCKGETNGWSYYLSDSRNLKNWTWMYFDLNSIASLLLFWLLVKNFGTPYWSKQISLIRNLNWSATILKSVIYTNVETNPLSLIFCINIGRCNIYTSIQCAILCLYYINHFPIVVIHKRHEYTNGYVTHCRLAYVLKQR